MALPDPHSSGADIAAEVIDVLRFYQAMGIERFPFPSAVSVRGDDIHNIIRKETASEDMRDDRAGSVKGDHSRKTATVSTDKAGLLNELRGQIGDCRRCKLSARRTNIVFGEGDPNARLMFIGEGPGGDEDLQGRPFVGKAGELLTRLIEKMELKREDVYIANIVKCRPPENREPEQDEIKACRGFLEAQIDVIRPVVIMTLGKVALQTLMDNNTLKITATRGKLLDYKGTPMIPTFHPAYLLRNPADKWKTWADAQKALERLHH